MPNTPPPASTVTEGPGATSDQVSAQTGDYQEHGSASTPEVTPTPLAQVRHRQRDVMDPSLILPRSTRSGKSMRSNDAALAVHYGLIQELPQLASIFTVDLHAKPKVQLHRMHRDKVPLPPRNWRQMLKHQYAKEFQQAASIEFKEIGDRGTWIPVPQPKGAFVIPLKWVYTYKFDADGLVTKFKARLCVRGDLQLMNSAETYAATLAARVFRFIMAIVAAFDLELH